MKLTWTKRARADLLEVGRYIARDKPGAARRWVERIRQGARTAARQPRAGRKVPEFNRDDLREVLIGNYRIVYEVHREEICVLTVFEGHHLLPKPLPRDSSPDSLS